MENEKRKAAGCCGTGADFEILRTHVFKPCECPKFQTCNAPVCPLQPELGRMLEGEAVCFYLLEAQKPGAKANFDHAQLGELYQYLSQVTPALLGSHWGLIAPLKRAKQTGSRMANGQRLREGGGHE